MSSLTRWFRFNLVGVLGMGLQLLTLATLNRYFPTHYLLATFIAVETALLHNFVWHTRYTWRDSNKSSRWQQLFRFHLANGATSLIGNLLLMRLLVQGFGVQILAANIVAITLCSIANFTLSYTWTFRAAPRKGPLPRVTLASVFALIFVASMSNVAYGQAPPGSISDTQQDAAPPSPQSTSNPLPNAPQPHPAAPPSPKILAGNYNDYYAGIFCATGATTSKVSTKPTSGCGFGFTFVPLPIFIEFGAMGPQANRSLISGYMSVDTNIALAKYSASYFPTALIGYSRLFETGNALYYGVSLALPSRTQHKRYDNLRFELRDYYTFANPTQHNVMLRVGWISEIND